MGKYLTIDPDDEPSAAQAPRFIGGNRVLLLRGGDELFPAMCQAMRSAQHAVWLATYIFQDDDAGRRVSDALRGAAARGVRVYVIVDGFGSNATLARLRRWLDADGIDLQVHRPVDRWWSLLRSGQLHRLHQKLCVVDERIAFVGGINIIDDRFDQAHGHSDAPRLDFAVELQGPVAEAVQRTLQAKYNRLRMRTQWPRKVRDVAASEQPVKKTLDLWHSLRSSPQAEPRHADDGPTAPVRVAFVVRDNFRRRHDIERSYIEAMRHARQRIDIACAYFYPGHAFKRSLLHAAGRGVRVRLLLQGKADYRIAALAAQVLYDELLHHGVRIFEYTPAFLHAKVAVIDDDWATVGSSNIDPLSLLLNLEANAVVRDAVFARQLRERFEQATQQATEVVASPLGVGWRRWFSRDLIAWCAGLYLRLAGISARY